MGKTQAIIQLLNEKGAEYELFEHVSVLTIADVEKTLNIVSDSMAKSLVIKNSRTGQYFVVVLRGCDYLDKKKLAAILEAPRDVLEFAKVKEIESAIGYPIGGIPPFGYYKEDISVVIDQSVMDTNPLYCGVGSLTKFLKIQPILLKELNSKVIIGDIKKGVV